MIEHLNRDYIIWNVVALLFLSFTPYLLVMSRFLCFWLLIMQLVLPVL